MPEQQRVDDVVESTSITGKKRITKLEKSSTALEKDQDNDAAEAIEVEDQDNDAAEAIEVEDQDNDAGIEVDDLKEQ
jgi:hypothetical protein